MLTVGTYDDDQSGGRGRSAAFAGESGSLPRHRRGVRVGTISRTPRAAAIAASRCSRSFQRSSPPRPVPRSRKLEDQASASAMRRACRAPSPGLHPWRPWRLSIPPSVDRLNRRFPLGGAGHLHLEASAGDGPWSVDRVRKAAWSGVRKSIPVAALASRYLSARRFHLVSMVASGSWTGRGTPSPWAGCSGRARVRVDRHAGAVNVSPSAAGCPGAAAERAGCQRGGFHHHHDDVIERHVIVHSRGGLARIRQTAGLPHRRTRRASVAPANSRYARATPRALGPS
jgi:hypothetical protein